MTTYTPKFKTVADIKRETGLALKQKTTWNSRIQLLALSVLFHISQHGDWTVALDFVNDITASDGVKKSSLRGYMCAMLAADITADSVDYDAGKGHKDIDMDKAQAVNWFDFAPPSAGSVAKTLGELLAQFEKGAKKSVKAGKVQEADAALVIATIEGLMSASEEVVAEAA